MSRRFFASFSAADKQLQLEGPEARHMTRVLRYAVGDVVELFNGQGLLAQAEITRLHRETVDLRIVHVEQISAGNSQAGLRIACPLPKGDRAKWMIEKLTELGVAEYQPLMTIHSVVEPGESKLDRLRQTVIEASKQCERLDLMRIAEVAPWKTFLEKIPTESRWGIAHPGGTRLASLFKPPMTVPLVAIGPEGGFTDEEVELATHRGAVPISLGSNLLRMETAALAVAASWCVNLFEG